MDYCNSDLMQSRPSTDSSRRVSDYMSAAAAAQVDNVVEQSSQRYCRDVTSVDFQPPYFPPPYCSVPSLTGPVAADFGQAAAAAALAGGVADPYCRITAGYHHRSTYQQSHHQQQQSHQQQLQQQYATNSERHHNWLTAAAAGIDSHRLQSTIGKQYSVF